MDSLDNGKCVHFQPADLIALAEAFLNDQKIPASDWEGRRFHWAGPIVSPPFNGLVLQCLRRQGNWVITKIDRRKEDVLPEEMGFKAL